MKLTLSAEVEMQANEDGKDLPVTSQMYVVTLIDVLGQRARLQELRELPLDASSEQSQKFVQALKKTLGTVHGVQYV